MIDTEYSDLKLLKLRKSNKIYTISEIQDMAYETFKKYKVKSAYLFGSYARNEAKRSSDIDIMIVGDSINSLSSYTGLALDLVQIFRKEIDIVFERTYTKQIKYDNDSMKKAKKMFYKEVLKDRVKIYG